MINRPYLLFCTVKFLKPVQIAYRLFYFLRKKVRLLFRFRYPTFIERQSSEIQIQESINYTDSYINETFTFLNLSKTFTGSIDWNFNGYGKLWTYNLSYFDFINQKNIETQSGLKLINSFVDDASEIKDGMDAFPISMRGINWIKFLRKNNIKDNRIDSSLYAQYNVLLDNLEFHLLGNHLLENGFSLLFGAYYFRDEKLYQNARKIITSELKEQILPDGAHFELSPMYHQLILFRMLDCYNLLKYNDCFGTELIELIHQKACLMLGWLKQISFKDLSIPLLNDSANNIAPTTKQLFDYAISLGLDETIVILNECGYRKIIKPKYEMVVDVGKIGPDYIPGHAHSDTFNFVLYIDNKPFIVDTGTSTYENNELRLEQRSTKAHNTVQLENIEQSEVWSSFRVGQRAKIVYLSEDKNFIEADHNGYYKKGVFHSRKLEFYDHKIIIEDIIDMEKQFNCYAYIHFYPELAVSIQNTTATIGLQKFNFNFAKKITLADYNYAPEFNKLVPAKMLVIEFENRLETEILITVH